MLDLEGNKVDDLGALQYLSWCPQLAVLTLVDNPVTADPMYQAQVMKAVVTCCSCIISMYQAQQAPMQRTPSHRLSCWWGMVSPWTCSTRQQLVLDQSGSRSQACQRHCDSVIGGDR